ncbi:rab-like protein 3 [Trichonephila clavipes]|nr:rab-like protein 3 [Trichonephila clavipes]
MASIEKVKILVVGDSGVGKSSLVYLIAHSEAITNPSWTIGCSVEVKLHEYKEGTPFQKTYFIEMWDVGGSSSHRNSRSIFYNSFHGVILVHDLTNRKSKQNLRKWLAEVLSKDSPGKKNNGCDESRFQLYPDDHRRRVWRRPGQRADPAFTIARHTGPQPGVIVWSAIFFDSRTPSVIIREFVKRNHPWHLGKRSIALEGYEFLLQRRMSVDHGTSSKLHHHRQSDPLGFSSVIQK